MMALGEKKRAGVPALSGVLSGPAERNPSSYHATHFSLMDVIPVCSPGVHST